MEYQQSLGFMSQGDLTSMQDLLGHSAGGSADMNMLSMTDLGFDDPDDDDSPLDQAISGLQRTETTWLKQTETLQVQQQATSAVSVDDMGANAGPGAGPMPTGYGMGPPAANSTLTEFTRRRNWSQRIIDEIKDFLHILTSDGRILYVGPHSKQLTGYEPSSLAGKFIGEFVHPDDRNIFMREFNESIATGQALRFFYRFKKEDGTYIIFECDGHPHMDRDSTAVGDGNNDSNGDNGECRGIFMMARPYPTKNAALLDSFLEHKIENVRLLTRIEELRREEVDENEAHEKQWRDHDRLEKSDHASVNNNPHAFTGALGDQTKTPSQIETPSQIQAPEYQGMPPPAKPSLSNTALTRRNLDNALFAQRPDSMADKMSRYEGSNHLETIELLTGLQYRDGERSHGISTGDTSPALIRGDAGIAILVDRDRDRDGSKDKKKIKLADEFVCADCGTLDSPEWRKGPKGPKTLCNACGLRWAKKEKKREGTDGGPSAGDPSSLGDLTPGMPKQDSMDSEVTNFTAATR